MDRGTEQLTEVDAHSSLPFPGLLGRVTCTSQSRSMVSKNGWQEDLGDFCQVHYCEPS